MSGASGSYWTGHSGTPCTAVKGTKNTAGSSIYTGPLCAFLGTLPALAPTLFVFVQTSGRGERGKRVEWLIMNTLCLCLLINIYLEQAVFPFISQTNWKFIDCFTLTECSSYHPLFHVGFGQVKNNVMPWFQVRKQVPKCVKCRMLPPKNEI